MLTRGDPWHRFPSDRTTPLPPCSAGASPAPLDGSAVEDRTAGSKVTLDLYIILALLFVCVRVAVVQRIYAVVSRKYCMNCARMIGVVYMYSTCMVVAIQCSRHGSIITALRKPHTAKYTV